MTTSEKRHVAETLQEIPIKISVGWFRFSIKPPTLSQIYDMGVIANDIDAAKLEEDFNSKNKINIIAETISQYKSARIMQEIFVILAFKSSFWRWMWRWYIRRNLTIGGFNQLINFIGNSFSLNFFLTSIIFLSQTKKITEPSPTTVHGQQSEE